MLPIDEMLIDFRTVLEEFELSPNNDSYDRVQSELMRMGVAIDDFMDENE